MRGTLLLLAATALGFGQVPLGLPGSVAPKPATQSAPKPAIRPVQPPPRPAPAKPAPGGGVSPRDLTFPPLHALQPPQAVTATLPNGLRVYLVEQHEFPAVGGAVIARTGYAFDPPGKTGLAGLAGMLLRGGGTSSKSPEQVARELAALGMTLDSAVRPTATVLTFNALRDTAQPALALLREILEHPAFDAGRLEVFRRGMRSTIAHRNDDSAAVAGRELSRLILGAGTPYGQLLNYSGLDRITGNDLRAFHRKYFVPSNLMLGIWGDFDARQMRAQVEQAFGTWTAPGETPPEFPKAGSAPVPGIYLAAVTDPSVSYLAIGQPSGMMTQKDAPALEVMALLFNRVQSRIRQRAAGDFTAGSLSLAGVQIDGARASWDAGLDHAGVFRITGSCRGAATAESVRAILDDIDRVRAGEIGDEDLRAAREAALSAFLSHWDTTPEGVLEMMILEYYGVPRDFIREYQAGIQAVTRADIQRVARQYLNPANLTIVVAGNPQVFSTPLEKVNPQVSRIDLSIPAPTTTLVETSDASLAEGKRLLARAQTAAGGDAKLASVKDYTLQAEYQIDPAVSGIGGSVILQSDRWIAAEIFRQDMTLSTGRVSAFSDGVSGWIVTPQGGGALMGTQLQQLRSDLFRSYFRLLLSDRVPGRTVNSVDANLVEISGPGGQTVRIEFDAGTGLPKRAIYEVPQATGVSLFGEDLYSDFRSVDGILYPFKTVIMQAGRRFAEVFVKDIRINTGLRQADLATRPQ